MKEIPRSSPIPEEVLNELPSSERAQAADVWQLLSEKTSKLSPDAGWARLEREIDLAEPRSTMPLRLVMPRVFRRPQLAWAAVVLLLFGVGYLFRATPVTIVVGPAAMQRVLLPDGSVITLNSQSRIQYRVRPLDAILTQWSRAVRLDGEGLFSITHTGQSFRVQTSRLTVEVLGTEFNIRDRAHTAKARVTLLSGTVRVGNPRGASTLILDQPGQSAAVQSGVVTGSEEDATAITSWTESGFVLLDESLQDLFLELEARFNRSIEVRGALDVGRTINMFYLDGASFDQILHDACLAQDCTYQEYGNRVVVSPNLNDRR